MKRIFIAEDDLFYGSMIREQLKEFGAEVEMFDNGEKCIQNLSKTPDIVILDHDLGDGLNGLETLKTIKYYNPNIHVIYLTAQKDMEVAINSLRYGAFNYIEKDMKAFDKLWKCVATLNSYSSTIKNIEKRRSNSDNVSEYIINM